jgi:PHD/YefM family antitoxin component YafN of YafNO toxin-antitoxin module
MIEATATDFAKRLGQYRRTAQREPVAVTDRARITEVLISKHDFDEYMSLKARAGRSLWVEDLADEMVEALETSRMDARHDHLNSLMED